MRAAILFVVCAAIAALPAQAEVVYVEATGFVEYNQVNFGIFADVNSGDPVTLYFEVDSDVFLNSSYYPTRGYAIDLASYSLTMGSVSVGLQQDALESQQASLESRGEHQLKGLDEPERLQGEVVLGEARGRSRLEI